MPEAVNFNYISGSRPLQEDFGFVLGRVRGVILPWVRALLHDKVANTILSLLPILSKIRSPNGDKDATPKSPQGMILVLLA